MTAQRLDNALIVLSVIVAYLSGWRSCLSWERRTRDDLVHAAWRLIANAGRGNWESEAYDWAEAAKYWRDKYNRRYTGPRS